MAPKKDKGKSKEIVSRGSTNRRATRSSSNRGREQTPSPPRSPESPPSTPPSSSDSEERQIVRKPRTNSMGKFGEKRRTKPNRVDMHGGRIFDDTAKKTLLAIIRDQWPNNLYTYTDIIAKDPRWMAEVVTEFKYFYKNLRGQSRVEATYSIEDHVKRTCKRLMNEEKDRLKKRMKDTGLSANELRPSYINPILWGNLLKYWDSDSHKHRSDVGAKNRKKVLTLHSAGAKSFEDIEMAQSAFIKGRSITDNILLAQELFWGYSRDSGVPRCALKIDLFKAFDSLNWSFLMASLEKMGFPPKFRGWVLSCISTAMYSVKVNGALSGYFKGAKGLRQGDPMSPYLFTIAMNIFSSLLKNIPTPFKYHWKCKDLAITNLLFADDVLLFSYGDKSSIDHIMECIDIFSNWSGLTPNIQKSSAFFCNCKPEIISWFDRKFGISHGTLPVRFLGVPLISTRLSLNDCQPLIERISGRLFCWTNIMLSLAGRTQLIRAVLFSIQAFWSNHFMLPGAIHKKLQSIFTRFLWKGDAKKSGGAKVSWENVCLLRDEGGLGLKNPKEWNKSQILNHLCKIISKSGSLWANWVNATALKNKHFWTMNIPSDSSWIWRRLLQLRPVARQFITFNLGNGLGTSLWFDPWSNNTCLASTQADLIISQSGLHKNSQVNSLINSGSWVLPRPSSRLHHINAQLSNWLASFSYPAFDLLKSDEIQWSGIPIRKLKIWHIWDSVRRKIPPVPWCKAVWHRLIISRYAHYQWLACHGRLSTLQRLASFGLDILDHCYLCVGGHESLDHLLITCPYGNFILTNIATLLGITCSALSWLDLISKWLDIHDALQRALALLVAQVLTYHIWRERNSRVHDRGVVNPLRLQAGILLDVKSRLSSSAWFMNHSGNSKYTTWSL